MLFQLSSLFRILITHPVYREKYCRQKSIYIWTMVLPSAMNTFIFSQVRCFGFPVAMKMYYRV
ncbi:Uncharacterized protein APZ42_011700 [Daphnia magna]|uniref:Uncharacterized protein n=1 Tax=Daphnia magna TaxID=35525 RepID=A0A162SWV6_9CRUS|nr:Uncharacterized protein APZ42_011700 [Daphnia magna]